MSLQHSLIGTAITVLGIGLIELHVMWGLGKLCDRYNK